METCTKCGGEGLIGNGPNPHLREGDVRTCDSCAGTGKIAATQPQQPDTAPEQADEAPAEPQQTDGQEKKDEQESEPAPAADSAPVQDQIDPAATADESTPQ